MATTTTTVNRTGFGLETASFTRTHWLAMGLAAVTGTVHVYLYLTEGFLPFLLAGLGFFGAIVLVLFNVYRRWLYLVGIPYTLAQMAAWFALGMPNFQLGVFDKTVQALLILALAYLFVTERRVARTAAERTGQAV